MFVGPWFSWTWFLVNAFAMGSPNSRKEILTAIGGLVGATVIVFLAAVLVTNMNIEEGGFDPRPYIYLVITVWQLGVSYYLYMLQTETFGLYEYFGGKVNNGILPLIAGALLGRRLISPVFEAIPLLPLIIG